MLIVLATSPRVAPGLLSWPAWEALRSAAVVVAPAGSAGSAPGMGSHTTAASESGGGSSAIWYAIPASRSAGRTG